MTNSFKQEPGELEKFLEFIEEDIENIRRVKEFCREKDLEVNFEIHPKAETVDESVQHSPVSKDQIVKTLIFKAEGEFVAVLAPGDRRVDTDKLKEIEEANDVRMANPDEVQEKSGYVIGGVSPFDLDLRIFMDESLLKNEKVRPAAGSRVVGAEVVTEELRDAINATVVDVSR